MQKSVTASKYKPCNRLLLKKIYEFNEIINYNLNKKYSYRCQLQLQNKGQNNSHNCDYSLDLMDQTTSNKLFWNRQNKTVSSEFLLNLYCNLMVIIKYKSLLNETIEK